MFTERDAKKERKIIEKLVSQNPELAKQHELFLQEMEFKQELISARKNKQLTQNDISELSGLSQQAVSRLEKGNGGNIETVIRYLSSIGLKLSIKWWLGSTYFNLFKLLSTPSTKLVLQVVVLEQQNIILNI